MKRTSYGFDPPAWWWSSSTQLDISNLLDVIICEMLKILWCENVLSWNLDISSSFFDGQIDSDDGCAFSETNAIPPPILMALFSCVLPRRTWIVFEKTHLLAKTSHFVLEGSPIPFVTEETSQVVLSFAVWNIFSDRISREARNDANLTNLSDCFNKLE